MFKVSFENLGVLSSGEVTIKPLTILCGENNSGKTYLNYSVYGMMKELFDYSAKNLSKYLPFPLEALRETGKAIIDLEEFLKNGFHKMLEEFSSHYSKSIHKIFNTSKNNFTYTKFQLTIDESYWFPLIKEHDIKFLYAGSRSNNVDDFEGKKKIRLVSI